MLRLVPPDFPELVGSSGYYVENYNCDILFDKIRSSLSDYCQKNDWYPDKKG